MVCMELTLKCVVDRFMPLSALLPMQHVLTHIII